MSTAHLSVDIDTRPAKSSLADLKREMVVALKGTKLDVDVSTALDALQTSLYKRKFFIHLGTRGLVDDLEHGIDRAVNKIRFLKVDSSELTAALAVLSERHVLNVSVEGVAERLKTEIGQGLSGNQITAPTTQAAGTMAKAIKEAMREAAADMAESISKAAPKLKQATAGAGKASMGYSYKNADTGATFRYSTDQPTEATLAYIKSASFQDMALKSAQDSANQTFRFRQNYSKSLEKSDADYVKSLQDSSNRTYAARMSWARAEDKAVRDSTAEAQKSSDLTYRYRQNYSKSLEKSDADYVKSLQDSSNRTYAARMSWARAEAKAEKTAAAEAQRSSDLIYRYKLNVAKAQEKSDADYAKSLQDSSNRTYAARMSWARAEDKAVRESVAEAQKSSDLTYRLRQNYSKAEARSSADSVIKSVAFAAPAAETELARLTSQLKKLREAQAFVEQGRTDLALKKFGQEAVSSVGSIGTLQARVDALRLSNEKLKASSDSAADALRRQVSASYSEIRFNAPQNLTARGKDQYAAQTLAATKGADLARAYLGPKAFLVDLQGPLDAHPEKVKKVTLAHREMNASLSDAHSAARGLAGSMGQMWLTWGNTAPLVAAAALGTTLKSVVSVGKDVEYQLSFVSALSGEAALGIDRFANSLRGGMVAPKEAADALRGLAQNGMNTRDAMASLPTILALATAGEMSLSDAALGATGVMSAFNLQVTDLGRVSDVFTKAAAMSNTSVSGMVEAMKQASSVAEKYDVSIEDIAATLSVMAKRNIEGSAAGTAVRNMFKELATPTKAAAEAMASVGIKAYDARGKLKPYEELLSHIKDQTMGLNQESRLAFLDRIFGERGGKAVDSLLTDLEKFKTARAELMNSDGFTQGVVDALSATTEGRLKNLMVNFKSSVASAFTDAKDPVDSFVMSLNKVFASDDFQKSAGSMVSTLANLSSAALRNVDTIAMLSAGFAGYRIAIGLAQAGTVAYTVVKTALTTATAALATTEATAAAAVASTGTAAAVTTPAVAALGTTTTAAATAAEVAAARIRLLQFALGGIGLALAVAGAAWALYGDHAKQAQEKQDDAIEASRLAAENAKRAAEAQGKAAKENLDYNTAMVAWLRSPEGAGKTTEDYANKVKGQDGSTKARATQAAEERFKSAEKDAQKAWDVYYAATQSGRGESAAKSAMEAATARADAAKTALNGAKEALASASATFDIKQADSAAQVIGSNRNKLVEFNRNLQELLDKGKIKKSAKDLLLGPDFENLGAKEAADALAKANEKVNSLLVAKKLPTHERAASGPRAATIAEANNRKASAQAELDRLRGVLQEERDSLQDHESKLKGLRLMGLLDEQSYQDRLNDSRTSSLIRTKFTLDGQRLFIGKSINTMLSGNRSNDDAVKFVQDIIAKGADEQTAVNDLSSFISADIAKKQGGRDNAAKILIGYTKQYGDVSRELRSATRDIEVATATSVAAKTDADKRSSDKLTNLLQTSDDAIARLGEGAAKNRAKGESLGIEKVQSEIRASSVAIDNDVKKTIRTLDEAAADLRKAGLSQMANASYFQSQANDLSAQAAKASGDEAKALLEQAKEAQAKADEAAKRAAGTLAGVGRLVNQGDRLVGVGTEAKDAAEQAAKDRAVQSFIDKPLKDSSAGLDERGRSMFTVADSLKNLVDLQKQYDDAVKLSAGNQAKLAEVEQAANVMRLNSLGTMVSGMRGMSKEGTRTYTALLAAERVMRAFQIAETLKTHAVKLGLMSSEVTAKVATEAAKNGVTAASEGSQTSMVVAGSQARAAAQAPEVMMRFLAQLGPWGMAAGAAAIVAVLGATVGTRGSFAETNKGTGTVRGDKDKGSESITKSIDRLKEVDTLTMTYSAAMLTSLRNIENGMQGLALNLYGQGNGNTVARGVNTTTGHNQVAGAQVGQIIGYALGGPIGGVIGTVAYAVASKIPVLSEVAKFVASTKTTVNGQGITAADQSFGQVASNGYSASYYADVTQKDKVFGITYSSKSKTITQAADSALNQQLGVVFSQIGSSVLAAAKQTGMDAAQAQSLINSSVISLGKIDTSGTADEVQARLTNVISAQADLLAQKVLPGMDAYVQFGEGYYQTTLRVTSAVEVARATLANLGVTAVDVTQVVNKQGDIAAEMVRDSVVRQEMYSTATGSLSKLGEAIRNMDGSAEEIAKAYKGLISVRLSLRSMGLTAVDAGSALLRGAGGLDALTSALDSYENNVLTASERTSAQALKMRAQFQALGLAMPKSIEQFKALVKSLDTASESDQELLGRVLALSDSFVSLTSTMEDLGSSVEAEIKRIRGLMVNTSSTGFATLQSQFAITTAKARAGDTAALDSLAEISQNLLAAGEKQAVTRADLLLLQARTAASLEETLAIAKASAGSVLAGAPAAESVASTAATAATAAVAQAAVTSPWKAVADAISTSFQMFASPTSIPRTGFTDGQLTGVPAFASGGYHSGGGRIVGENGPEFEVTGPAMYWTATQTQEILSGGRSGDVPSDGLLGVIESLKEEIRALREDQRQHTLALARGINATASTLQRMSPDGDALAVRVAK